MLKAADDRKISSAEAVWLQETVKDRLGPYTTLREYVVRTIGPDLSHLHYVKRDEQFQAFRHRWLQHLCLRYENNPWYGYAIKRLDREQHLCEEYECQAVLTRRLSTC